MLDSTAKGEKFQDRESTLVKRISFIHTLGKQTKQNNCKVLKFQGKMTGDILGKIHGLTPARTQTIVSPS